MANDDSNSGFESNGKEALRTLGPKNALCVSLRSVYRVSPLQNGSTPPEQLNRIQTAIDIAENVLHERSKDLGVAMSACSDVEKLEAKCFGDYVDRKLLNSFENN